VQTQMLVSAKNVRAVGTETIGGVKTTHYTGSYPLAAGLARLPASMRAAARQALQGQANQVIGFSVWIDAQHGYRSRKVNSLSPMRTRSPGCSGWGPLSSSSLRYVPLVEPRSSITMTPPWASKRASRSAISIACS